MCKRPTKNNWLKWQNFGKRRHEKLKFSNLKSIRWIDWNWLIDYEYLFWFSIFFFVFVFVCIILIVAFIFFFNFVNYSGNLEKPDFHHYQNMHLHFHYSLVLEWSMLIRIKNGIRIPYENTEWKENKKCENKKIY